MPPHQKRAFVCAFVFLFAFGVPAADDWQPRRGPLMTQWAAEVSPTNALLEYPRPQMQRADWVNLNGLWDYTITPLTNKCPVSWEGKLLVPFPVESALSGVMRPLDEKSTLWYRRSFGVPREWSGRRVVLRFGAVDWQARVFVNGRFVGQHRGGYDAFAFDVTDALQPGQNQELVVAVWDPTEGDQPRGKQSRKPEGIFYNASSGLWQTVWIEPVPAQGIMELKMTPELDEGALRMRVITKNPDDALQVEAVASCEGREAGRVSGSANVPLLLKVNPIRAWSPDHPFLYQLHIALSSKGRVIDEVNSYFGLRSVGLQTDEHGVTRLTLNGKPFFQMGALDQGFWPDGIYTAPTDGALRHDIEFLKSAGFNLARKHVKVEPDRWYYWCDKLGLLVWQDMPSGNNNTSEARSRFEAEFQRMVGQLRNHPCIVTWVLFNEGWGQFDTERLSRSLKEMDPSRIVDNASGWTDKHAGELSDVHTYPIPDSPAPETSRALVIGEFGGLGLSLPAHQWSSNSWSYQMLPDQQALEGWYYHLLKQVWSQKESRGLSAAIYTQTTDVETECNGLLTYDRRIAKIPLARLAAMNTGQLYRLPMQVILTNAVFGEPVWKYTFERPASHWMQPDFDDRTWPQGPGGFGTSFTRGSIVHTTWKTPDVWLRRSFMLGNDDLRGAKFHLHHDKSVEVYLNGVLALSTKSYLVDYALFDIAPEALATLHPGTNSIAVHCDQTAGGQFIDVGIVSLSTSSREEAKVP